MTVTISAPTNGQRTFTFTRTAPDQRVLDIVEYAAHRLFDLGYGDHGQDGLRAYSALSNAEKLNMLDDYFTSIIRKQARDYYTNNVASTAIQTADNTINFNL